MIIVSIIIIIILQALGYIYSKAIKTIKL